MSENYILRNAHRIKGIPVSIIHGRYDMVCSPLSAYLLHKQIKTSKLFFTVGGHSASDPETEKVLVREINGIVR